MSNNFYVVIMAGGSGTRLWPISRESLPKQFHKLSSNERSLLQETYDRALKIVPKENIYVSLVEQIYETTLKQLPDVPKENYIIEPQGKNTAPAIGLIATLIFNRDPNAIIATIASDHTIENEAEFPKAIKTAFDFIEENPQYLVTIGIKPTEPNTGYGYIKVGDKFPQKEIFKVEQFKEKPDLDTAKKYLQSGKYLWNASYFIWRAENMLNNFEAFAPQIHQRLGKISKAISSSEYRKILLEEYTQFLKEPIEPVIIEKMDKVAVIPSDLGWSDVGTWSSLYEILAKNSGDHTISRGHHVGIGDKNCLFYAQDKLLATVGLEDVIIVDTPDVTLVLNKNKAQEIKNLMEKLKDKGEDKYL